MKAGPGRPKGLQNKVTREMREAFKQLVDGNLHLVQGWLEQIAQQDGPNEALKRFLDMAEYAIPKLSRTEVTGEDGGPLSFEAFVANLKASDDAK